MVKKQRLTIPANIAYAIPCGINRTKTVHPAAKSIGKSRLNNHMPNFK